MFWDQEEILLNIKKNTAENIILRYVVRNNKQYFDIRINKLITPEKVYKPTSMGVVIPIDDGQAKHIIDCMLEKLSKL